ncbi:MULTISPECIES: HK97-gp10 family putative phage morphogenesis protein [unclassified Mammaliicoccus]|uniref:HK97-gp10 family putative phage morphogenesis protein n=1 Tax=unclassified Mammaliicoccus TaxID=2803851 RepID=UPI001EFBD5B1|nr:MULTISPECIES: HK97-gp10 family putative phage morphogenesis protein [unclassified Mammaliicoccus]
MGAKIEKNTMESGLRKQVRNFPKIQNRVLKAGASSLIPLMVKNTPKSERTKHAKDHVAMSNVKTDRDSYEKYVTIGYERGYSHRIHVIEFGTMYQRPQLFITKSEKEGRSIVNKAMVTAMRRGMRK